MSTSSQLVVEINVLLNEFYSINSFRPSKCIDFSSVKSLKLKSNVNNQRKTIEMILITYLNQIEFEPKI